ncbi:unnamed protein product, partial [Choristocarpus tenellus]
HAEHAPSITLSMQELLFTISRGHLAVTRELLEGGADPNVKDKLGRTPLWLATDENNKEVVQTLCEAGAMTNLEGPEGRTPLHLAARKGLSDIAEILLRHRAQVDGNPDK